MGNRQNIQTVHRALLEDYGVEVVRGRRGSAKLVHAQTGKRVSTRRFMEIAADMRERGLQLVPGRGNDGEA